MLVYGDAPQTVSPRARLTEIADKLGKADNWPDGLAGHSLLVEIFLDAAEIGQALIDAEFAAAGQDASSPTSSAVTALLLRLAEAVRQSWTRGFTRPRIETEAALKTLLAVPLPETVTVKLAEGYAFYALYPESYLEAAGQLGIDHDTQVIGIRSIGLGLAALVAVAAESKDVRSVRPVGHPFRRELALDGNMRQQLLVNHDDRQVAVVDEGPGLSGSSFGAVVDFLTDNGIPENSIHLFPSHSGEPGHEAEPRQRDRWRRLTKHVVSFEPLFLDTPQPERRLENWFTDVVGPARDPLTDLSGGHWRQLVYAHERDWPPANMHQERRKYLLRTDSGPVLLKFAGIGRSGRAAFERATVLADAGFSPPAIGFRHGFLAQRWFADARPVANPSDWEKTWFTASYLSFRAQHFSADKASGASLDQLAEMLRHNAREGLGPAFGPQLEAFAEATIGQVQNLRRVATDNRMHLWEWLRTGDGCLLKTDAVDHCAAHDLIGSQDIAWDVIGAGIELSLTPEQQDELIGRVETTTGALMDRALLRLYEPCYLAFQLGSYSMAAAAMSWSPEEVARLSARADWYGDQLSRWMETNL